MGHASIDGPDGKAKDRTSLRLKLLLQDWIYVDVESSRSCLSSPNALGERPSLSRALRRLNGDSADPLRRR